MSPPRVPKAKFSKPSQPVQNTRPEWTIDTARGTYGIGDWGGGFFDINEEGNVVVTPVPGGPSVSISSLVQGLRERGIDSPVLLRFSDILDSRMQALYGSFAKAIANLGYKGKFKGVYPIKVNQQQQVVAEIVRYGGRYHHGLEAGSKAELVAALGCLADPEALVVCNGYKDEEFVDLALFALKMGMQTILVIELPSELSLILDRAKRMGVRPRLGVRARLTTTTDGHWADSSGDKSAFGLNAPFIIDVVDSLRNEGMLDCLEMLHFHIGSQITNIRHLRNAVSEAGRIYTSLVEEGARMGLLNVGGGLAVDYDGSHSNSASSCNYTLDEYAADIVEVVLGFCERSKLPHPIIVCESGRAAVAHHSVLLFNILEASRFEAREMPDKLPDDAHEYLRNLSEVGRDLSVQNAQECYNDALYYRDSLRFLFDHGSISLRHMALGERIFWSLVPRIAKLIESLDYVPEDLEELDTIIADVYHANFSVFQSLPDSWAIGQLFPVMPIHRLTEQPDRKAVISDITCDCDGQINRFIHRQGVKHSLPVHHLNGEDYLLGVFLVGAYQETLGDLHNLLGDTNVVGIRISESGEVEYAEEIAGDSVADVLSYVEYNPAALIDRFRRLAESAVRQGRISPQERRQIMKAYEDGLRGYTYYEN